MKPSEHRRMLYSLIGFVLILAWWPMTGLAADFLLKWNPNTDSDEVQGYNVYYKAGSAMNDDPASADQMVEILLDASGFDPQHPSHTLFNLDDSTLYFFAVSAFNAAGESAFSDEVSLCKGPGCKPDLQAPVVTAPADMEVTAADDTGMPASDAAIVTFLSSATAMDDVDGPITDITHDAPAQFPMGVTTVTFSATDSTGHIGSAQATVTVLSPAGPAGDNNSGSGSGSGGSSGCFIRAVVMPR